MAAGNAAEILRTDMEVEPPPRWGEPGVHTSVPAVVVMGGQRSRELILRAVWTRGPDLIVESLPTASRLINLELRERFNTVLRDYVRRFTAGQRTG